MGQHWEMLQQLRYKRDGRGTTMVEQSPDSTRHHLDNADAAAERAKERLSESALLRASVLRLKVSQTNLPAVRLPISLVPESTEK